ncbi:G-protein coupled receptor 61-like [Tubulanus polymorphus]|uniref:G-protein coupled receptor 61-like n=1 Tax=Tubulanus polymorphus TaxID=672921 RepID=UPI003DA310F7
MHDHLEYSKDWVLFVFVVIINFTTFFTNITVFATVIGNELLRNNLSNVFVLNLCIIDIIAGGTVLPLSITTFYHGKWTFSDDFCKAAGFLINFLVTASIFSTCIISIERFFSIKLPMRHSVAMTPKKVAIIVILIWVTSSIICCLPMFVWNVYEYRKERYQCTFNWTSTGHVDGFVIVCTVLTFIIPGIVILVMYLQVYRIARRSAAQVHPIPTISQTVSQGENSGDLVETSRTVTTMANTSLFAHQRAIVTLFVIVGAYFLLWGPYFTMNLVLATSSINVSSKYVEMILTWIAFMSFAINPLVYGLKNVAIREKLIHICHKVKSFVKTGSLPREESQAFEQSSVDFYQFLRNAAGSSTPHSQTFTRESRTSSHAITTIKNNNNPQNITHTVTNTLRITVKQVEEESHNSRISCHETPVRNADH